MKKFLMAFALAAVGAFSLFGAGEYVARGIQYKAFDLDGKGSPIDAVITLDAGHTVAPYAVQVLSATKASRQNTNISKKTYTVIDRVDSPTYTLIYTNGNNAVTNRLKKLDAVTVAALKPFGYQLKSQSTNHVWTLTTNTLDRLVAPASHYSVTTNTVTITGTNIVNNAATGKVRLFGVETIKGFVTTNDYLAATDLSSGKLSSTSCYQATTPLFGSHKLHVTATQADKMTVKVVYLTFGK